MTLKEHINMILDEQQRKEQEKSALDAKLSWPFKKWDIIADVKWELIWVFDNVAYHWWDPDVDYLWNFIFADFKRAISKQWWTDWRIINVPCWDDDVYIDRRKYNLTKNYRFATEAEKNLFNTLMTREMVNEQNSKLKDKEKRRLRMKKKRKARRW